MTENITKIFKGYFSSKETLNRFLECLPKLKSKKIKIADFGGGSGYLLNQVKKFYQNKNCQVDCWIIDKDNEQLKTASNSFRKIEESCLRFYKDGYFDIIIMRSVLQFLLSDKDKIAVLNNVCRSLKNNGTFVNQALFLEKPDNKIVARAYQYFNRSLKIETLEELIKLYNQSNFKNCKIQKFCPIMPVDQNDIQERFNVSKSVINKILNLFSRNIDKAHSIEIKNKNFKINCGYVVATSQNKNG